MASQEWLDEFERQEEEREAVRQQAEERRAAAERRREKALQDKRASDHAKVYSKAAKRRASDARQWCFQTRKAASYLCGVHSRSLTAQATTPQRDPQRIVLQPLDMNTPSYATPSPVHSPYDIACTEDENRYSPANSHSTNNLQQFAELTSSPHNNYGLRL